MPAGGEVKMFEYLHRKLIDEDSGWELNPESTYGQRQLQGEENQGGLFLQVTRRVIRTKWEATVGSTGSGGTTPKAANAHKWLESRGLIDLAQHLFSRDNKVRGRSQEDDEEPDTIDLTAEAGTCPGKRPATAFGRPNSKTWGLLGTLKVAQRGMPT